MEKNKKIKDLKLVFSNLGIKRNTIVMYIGPSAFLFSVKGFFNTSINTSIKKVIINMI
ncbi:hypothetical protein GCM10023311_14620 [Flaviramulus aquimarinus]|uniref:Uncharacterized protein n=1 Tax=Flaviramulus aquimarinus TaxID=1170456 RepID=A0ABP9F0W4_9FLAO